MIPVTSPVVASTVATAVLLLLHVPPATSGVKVMVAAEPEHMLDAPVMDVGGIPIVTAAVAAEPQPVE